MTLNDLYRNPYGFYSQLRNSGPMHFNAEMGPAGSWLIPRYDDVAGVFRSPHLTTARSHLLFKRFTAETQKDLSGAASVYRRWAVFSDPPSHTLWRRIIMLPLTPSQLDAVRPCLEETIDRLIEDVASSKQIDFVAEFALLLPAQIMCAILGLPDNDGKELMALTSELTPFLWDNAVSTEVAIKAQAALLSLHEYFQNAIRQRIAKPCADGISLMLEAVRATFALSEQHEALFETLPSQCCALLVAGSQTTTDLLSNGIYALLRHPDQLQLVRQDPHLALKAATEVIRYDSPVHADARIVHTAFQLHGCTLEPGQMVTALIASANHDEQKFAEPEAFKITRETSHRALTFGNSPHRCVGEQLSYLELTLVIQKLLKRFSSITLLQKEVEYKKNLRLRGVKSLHVALQAH